MDNKLLDKKITEIIDLVELWQAKYFSWLKNIITISVGLLGIIVSLKSEISTNIYQHIFFVITISSLALGILSGVIVLYSEMHILNKVRQRKQEYIRQALDGNQTAYQVGIVEPSSIYHFFRYLCYFSYIISLISLVIYAIYSDI